MARKASGSSLRGAALNNTVAIALIVSGVAASLALKATGRSRLDGDVQALGAISVGAVIPDLEVETLGGERLKLSTLRGKVALLDFGATWCGPCRGMLRPLRELSDQISNEPARIVSVHVGEEPEHVTQHYKDRFTGGIQLTVDRDGVAARSLGVQSFPTFVVLDKGGIVRRIHVGAFHEMKPVREQMEQWARQ
jgi:thiol-disulfide isomerase/thioredoxin